MTATQTKAAAAPDADALAQICAYAEQVQSAEDGIEKDSVATAEKLRLIYDDKSWMTPSGLPRAPTPRRRQRHDQRPRPQREEL